MSGWIVLGAWLAGLVFMYRKAYVVISDDGDMVDDRMDAVFVTTISAVVGAMWPVALPIWVIWRVATPKTAAARRQEATDLEDHKRTLEMEIRALERQSGIQKEGQ